jgi:hypothetical protein
MNAPQSNIKLFLYTPNRFFVIPNFQRPYSWTADNIDSFLADLEDVKASGKKHYFGSIVYVNNGDNSVIIDGQQRATTVLLMITAIYHIAVDHPEKCSIISEQIKDEYLFNKYAKQYGTEENRIKLRAVTSDNEVFEKIFSKDNLDETATDSKLYRAYQRFYNYFSGRDHLEEYMDTLKNFEIVTIILDKDDDNPQKVFESINSTGKPLTDGDKIRNFALMLHTQEKQDHVLNKYWEKIEKTLTNTDKDYITDFFRMYIMSVRQAVVKMDAVYPEFKKLFVERVDSDQSLESLDAFYGDIVKSLEHYRLLKFDAASTSTFSSITNTIFVMQYLRIDLYAPFAMSVMRLYENEQIDAQQLKKVFEAIQIYFARRIACNILSTSLDRLFATLHRDAMAIVETNDVSYADAVAYSILSRTGQLRIPSDTELEASIKANAAYSQRTTNVNYLLTAIDDMSKESALLKQIADRDIKLSIEHVMPQTLTDAWRTELGEDAERIHATYLHGLANLTLTGYNSEYSNLPFDRKKTMEHGFNDSPLAINRTVAKYDHWNEEALLERQQWWIDNLKVIWPLPTSSYAPEEVERKVDLLDNADLTGSAPVALAIRNDIQAYANWSQIIDAIAEYCYELDEEFYEKVSGNDKLARWFSRDANEYKYSAELLDSGVYVNINSSTQQKMQVICELAEVFGLEKGDLVVELREGPTESLKQAA